jgi:hypothetical protein
MNPTLLFDSSCPSCSRVAEVARGLAGPLEIRSLDDPEIQGLLDELAPDRRREPMLLTSPGGRPRLLRGWRMRVELARLAGPGGALQLARALREAQHVRPPGGEHELDRRGLLVRAATAVGALLLAGRVGQAAPALGRPSHLAADDPIVKRLRTSRSARMAERAFGTPDWSSVAVRRPTDGDGALGAHSELYVVRLPSRGTQHTALVLAHPRSRASRAAAASSDPALMTDDVVVQTQGRGSGARIRWFTVDGRLLLDRPLKGAGDTHVGAAALAYRRALRGEAVAADVCPGGATVSASGEVRANAAQVCIIPRLFLRCFVDCLGRHIDADCAASCVDCAQGQIIPGCTMCYFCAGPHARRCMQICRG